MFCFGIVKIKLELNYIIVLHINVQLYYGEAVIDRDMISGLTGTGTVIINLPGPGPGSIISILPGPGPTIQFYRDRDDQDMTGI